jgi:AraC family transcriptional regulator of adaptative response / DNA-3-methyladenine glycosylase II
MRRFLADRPLHGVEAEHEGGWVRSLSVDLRQHTLRGWLAVAFDEERQEVRLRLCASLAPALGTVLARVRHLLDLNAEPARIDAALGAMPAYRPGLRVPGCIDGFETTARIILGQQVTVAAACTLAGRLVARFGEPISTPYPAVQRLFPTPAALAAASPEDIGTLGIVRTRVQALQALARVVASGTLELHPAAPLEATLDQLRALPGVGDWTCELVALRVLAWPDAFPATDAGVAKALGGLRGPAAAAQAEIWRPWRSYAVMQLWQTLHANRPCLAKAIDATS